LSGDRTITQDLGDVPVMAISTENLPAGLRLSFPGKKTFLMDREEIRARAEEWGELPFIEFDFVRIAHGFAEAQCECLEASPDRYPRKRQIHRGIRGLMGTQILFVKGKKGWQLKKVLASGVA